jgi:cyclopropane-fatty-acyl-phospholipid synthase
MEHVCRKLRLRPGLQVVEAGCGWGALSLHMARRYDVSVRAYNVSATQISFARQRVRQEGLEERVEFIEDDWRHMRGPADVFVSIGMLEHVGVRDYGRLGDVIRRCLRPEGWGLIHTIGQNQSQPVNPWVQRHIFPGAHPPSLGEMMQIFEPHGFSILDVENLRLHYALTLTHWLRRFDAAAEVVREGFGESFVRTWRLYLTASIAGFNTGNLQLFQVLFVRGTNNQIPRTRDWIYPSRCEPQDAGLRWPGELRTLATANESSDGNRQDGG